METEQLAQEIIGLSEQEAVQRIQDEGKTHRVVQRDGRGNPMTYHKVDNRINLIIDADGNVSDTRVG